MSTQTTRRDDATNKVLAPKLPIITAELLRSESRLSTMDKFGKVRCQVCGRAFKAYDALEQHIGASHYGLNNPYAKVLEAAQIAAGVIPSGKEQEAKRVSLTLGDLVSSKTKTSNSMVSSLAAYFKTEKQTSKRIDKKDGIAHGGVLIKSTNTASSTGIVLRRGKEREGGKKKRRSTLKKIILRERTMVAEALSKKMVEEEVEVEIEVRIGWVYVQLEYSDNDRITVNLMCMDGDGDEEDKDADDDDVDGDTAEVDHLTDEEDVHTKEEPAVVQAKLEKLEARVPAGAWGVRSLLDVLKGEPTKKEKPPAPAKKVKVKEETKTCELCGVPCYGIRAWDDHVNGKIHLKKLAIKNDPEKAAAAAKVKPATTYVGTEGERVRYVNQIITAELNVSTFALLSKLKAFQDRLYHTDKIKAKMRRRLLYGLREVAKSVDVKTSKLIVVAPNIEKIEAEGGLDDRINNIITDARANDIPLVFALTKKRIGKALNITSISVVSVLDFNGADEEFKLTLKHAAEGRALFTKHVGGTV
jgi:selenocysteine insertion sequence-binding protein 2